MAGVPTVVIIFIGVIGLGIAIWQIRGIERANPGMYDPFDEDGD